MAVTFCQFDKTRIFYNSFYVINKSTRNLYKTNLKQLSTSFGALEKNRNISTPSGKFNFKRDFLNCNITSKRYYSVGEKGGEKSDLSQDERKSKRSLPQLMDFPEIVWPSVLKTIKNFILVHLIIRPYFDREFNLPDFTSATKHALQVVSHKVSSGDLNSLDGLVNEDIVPTLQQSISKMSVAQRSEVNCITDDIYFSFPYQVGIMFDETNDSSIQKRFVEITMVFHVLRGLKEMQERGETPPLNVGMLPEYRNKISICNYRFIKEFTKGNESDWTVNVINHFKPSDYLDE